MMFDTAQEANQKLSGSIVMYNQDPVWCRDAREHSGRVQMYVARARDSVELGWIPLSDLDIKNLGERVGYFNMDYGGKYKICSYGRRLPVRHVQACQGLSNSNVRIDNMPWSVIRAARFTDVMTMGGHEALTGKYPGLAAVKYQFSKGGENTLGFAFDKNFALQRGNAGLYNLMYKGKNVGWTEDFFRFRIEKGYRYLDEDFEKFKIEVRS